MPISAFTLAAASSLLMNQAAVNTPEEVVHAAAILGINAETMASAGVYGSEVTTVLNRIRDSFADVDSYESAMMAASAAQNEIFGANAELRLNPDDAEAAAGLATATAALSTALSSAALTRSSLIDTVFQGVATHQHWAAVFEAPSILMAAPPEFRHAVLSDEQAAELAWAVRLSERFGDGPGDLPIEASALLTAANGNTNCQLARTWITTHTTSNQLAITQWVNTP